MEKELDGSKMVAGNGKKGNAYLEVWALSCKAMICLETRLPDTMTQLWPSVAINAWKIGAAKHCPGTQGQKYAILKT
jgi:hypothetical protein